MNLSDKDRAFKWRKYSMICSLINQASSSLVWQVKYIGDKRCSQCSKFCDILYNIEEEILNPKLPLPICDIPFGMCTAIAGFEPLIGENGRPQRNGKNYKKLLKIVIDKN